jgi:hypothetical protein
MHATTEQLLSLRDGQPVMAEVAAHVAGCAHCGRRAAELEQTRAALRTLPDFDPPPGAWSAVTASIAPTPDVRRRQAHWLPRWQLVGGLAAGFTLGLALIVNMTQRPDDLPMPGTTTDLVAATPAPASSVNGASRAELLETSRRLEAELRALPAAPQVTRASTAYTIAELQDHIFQVDLLLGDPALDPAAERALWQQRVRLMDTLMQVRYSQLAEGR